MADIDWVNKDVASFTTKSAWVGGVVPTGGNVAVISSAGDPAPGKPGSTGIISPAAGSSHAYLSGLTLSTDSVEEDHQPNGHIIKYYVTPQESAVPAGETISPAALDLIGAGSEAALTLQNSTIAAATVTNVSGDAYVYAGYTNTLKGAINIGEPFNVNGRAVTSSSTDGNGFKNALYIDVQAYGSWSGANQPNGYVPGVTSDGTISVASASGLWISVAGNIGKTSTSGTVTTETPTDESAFTNNGAIHVSAGGSLHVSATGGLGELTNNGSITLAGAASETTIAQIQSVVQGSGTWVLSGGSQTNPAYTGAVFGNDVLGQTFKISDATLFVDAGTGITENNCLFAGGNVDFDGKSGVLLIWSGIDQPITSVFSDSISGFATGDQIQLSFGLLPNTYTFKPELSWNAATNTLTLTSVTTSSLGTASTVEATFKLNGSYSAADFSMSNIFYNGNESTQASVTILSSVADAAPALLPADWASTSVLGLTGDGAHGTTAGLQTHSAIPTSEGIAALGHFDWLTTAHDMAGFHLHI